MAQNLMKSLADIESMLKDISKEGVVSPHVESEASNGEAECPYCIKNGSYVRVEDDAMTAWIYLKQPGEGEEFYSKSTIIEFINEHGVTNGLHQSNIAAIAKKHVYEREIIIAKGEEPEEGENGYFEFFFDTADKRKPQIREDGTVDYSSMSSLSNVEVGDKVAEYHPAVESKAGFDVLGKEITAKAAHELTALRGRGIANDKNPNIYYATVAGKIDYSDGHIDIKNVHEVNGDVDLTVGKVEFFGDIHITGNVGTGVLIRASRNVTIDGVVEAATIYAGGDVTIARGIQGNQKGKVTAKGNVSAEFIEHAYVEAGGNVRANSFINSHVRAAGMALAEGKNGLILGGSVCGLLGVSAVCIGNEMETKTYVGSGYSVDDYDKYIEAFQKEGEAQKLLSDTVEQMTEILKKKRLGNNINSDALDRELIHLNEKKDEYFEQLDAIRNSKELLSNIIEKGKGSVILANDKIFRGVTICVEGCTMNIPENTCFMRYKNEAGRIIPSVIVLN